MQPETPTVHRATFGWLFCLSITKRKIQMALSLKRAAELRAAKRTAAKASNQSNAGFKFPKGGSRAYKSAAVGEYKRSGNLIKANKAGIAARSANQTKATAKGKDSSGNS